LVLVVLVQASHKLCAIGDRQTDRQTDVAYSPLTTSGLNNEQAKMLADTVSVTAAESTAAPENKSL